MDKICWTSSIQKRSLIWENERAGVTKEKETQQEKKDRLTRIICAIVMTFVGASFLGQKVCKEGKLWRERQCLIHKKERNTEGEKRQINQNCLCNCNDLYRGKISWTNSIQGKQNLGEKERARLTKKKETQKEKETD